MAQSPSQPPTTSSSSSLTSYVSARLAKDERKLSYLQITIHQIPAGAAAAAAEQPEGERQQQEQQQQQQQQGQEQQVQQDQQSEQSQTPAPPAPPRATIEVRIINSHPTRSFTVLTWDCPLDEHALRMKRYVVTDADTGEAVKVSQICCLRRPPPPRHALIEIQPGQTVSRRHTLHASEFDITSEQRLKIRTSGHWRGIWMVAKAELEDADLENMERLGPRGKNRKLHGVYTSEEFEVVVE